MAVAANTAIVALTAGGAMLADKIALHLQAELYLPTRLKEVIHLSTPTYYFDDFSQCVKQLFSSRNQLIFIMATGIVVRKIADLLVDKQVDPAVVVMDERANFAISLLSGHHGGANKLARQLSLISGARPVITTATDVCGKGAVDLLAQSLQCNVYPAQEIKTFNRLLVEDQPVNLYSQWPLPVGLNLEGFLLQSWTDNVDLTPPAVVITNRLVPQTTNIIKLRPQNLVVGIGCRRGVTMDEVISAIKSVLTNYELSFYSVKQIATVDLKDNEQGLLAAAAKLKVPIEFVAKKQILGLAGQYQHSDKVQEKIGVGAVCEPAAMIVSRQGKLIVKKQIIGRVTVAVAEQALWW